MAEGVGVGVGEGVEVALEVADVEGQPPPITCHPECLSGCRMTSDVSGSMTHWPSGFVAAVLGPGDAPGLSFGPLLSLFSSA